MNIGTNLLNSVTGHVDKAILCVKKPAESKEPQSSTDAGKKGLSVSGAISAAQLAQNLLKEKKSLLRTNKEAANGGYHMLKVKYNPSRIQLDSRTGSFMQAGPGGAVANALSQITMPAQTTLSFELLFDEENHQDAFMFDKITNLSAGAVVSDAAGMAKTRSGEGYTVRPQVEALIGMLTQSETRQVVFYWSDMAFAGEVVSVDAKYTMFNSNGNPIRAVVRLTIQQGGEDRNGLEDAYWDKAFDELDGSGSGIAGKVGNLLNLR